MGDHIRQNSSKLKNRVCVAQGAVVDYAAGLEDASGAAGYSRVVASTSLLDPASPGGDAPGAAEVAALAATVERFRGVPLLLPCSADAVPTAPGRCRHAANDGGAAAEARNGGAERETDN